MRVRCEGLLGVWEGRVGMAKELGGKHAHWGYRNTDKEGEE